MIRRVSLFACATACLAFAATAQSEPAAATEEDEIVRLPGNGQVRDQAVKALANTDRLKPGAGLFLTFDQDNDGRISRGEIDAGIPSAFEDADGNADGHLTALEQRDWAQDLPTRDDSLANPFRFDPNLDRRVDLDEFTQVITDLAADYADAESGDIIVADLKAPRPERRGALFSADPNRPVQRGRVDR